MPYRLIPLADGFYYHIFNRGVEKRKIFSSNRDFQRFLNAMYYYQFSGPKPSFSQFNRFKKISFQDNSKIIELVGYCLMPNHFHFLLRQLSDNGISEYINKISISYTKYFNIKYHRVGPLLQGAFKAVLVENDEQLVQLSRYIHLNPYVAEIVSDPSNYKYSSYLEYISNQTEVFCTKEIVMNFFNSPSSYEKFVKDYEDYALRVAQVKGLLLDEH